MYPYIKCVRRKNETAENLFQTGGNEPANMDMKQFICYNTCRISRYQKRYGFIHSCMNDMSLYEKRVCSDIGRTLAILFDTQESSLPQESNFKIQNMLLPVLSRKSCNRVAASEILDAYDLEKYSAVPICF